jgi:hypothetical protein
MAHVEAHVGRTQAVQPGAQQRCGFHIARENPLAEPTED